MKFCKFLPLQWLGLEEELHKDLALLQEPRTGRPRDRDSAGAGPPVLATLSPCRGRRLGPCGGQMIFSGQYQVEAPAKMYRNTRSLVV